MKLWGEDGMLAGVFIDHLSKKKQHNHLIIPGVSQDLGMLQGVLAEGGPALLTTKLPTAVRGEGA